MLEAVETPNVGVTCPTSGLSLIRPPGHAVHRVAKQAYGPLKPPSRDKDADRQKWSRWDTPGRTIYAGDTPVAAFTEVLAYLKAALPAIPIAELFPDDPIVGTESLLSAVTGRTPGGMPNWPMRDAVSKGWREARCHYELALPSDEWLIEITTAESIAAINRAFAKPDGTRPDWTLGHLTGDNRSITCKIATWARTQTLFDGSRAAGILYRSKYGMDLPAYALWLRATDDGNPAAEKVRNSKESEISRHYDPLVSAAGLHGLKIF